MRTQKNIGLGKGWLATFKNHAISWKEGGGGFRGQPPENPKFLKNN